MSQTLRVLLAVYYIYGYRFMYVFFFCETLAYTLDGGGENPSRVLSAQPCGASSSMKRKWELVGRGCESPRLIHSTTGHYCVSRLEDSVCVYI